MAKITIEELYRGEKYDIMSAVTTAQGTAEAGSQESRGTGRNAHGQAEGNARKVRGMHERDAQHHRARCVLIRIPTRSAADGRSLPSADRGR